VIRKIILLGTLILLSTTFIVDSFFSGSVYEGEGTSNFDGNKFFNSKGKTQKNFLSMMKLSKDFMFKKSKWPKKIEVQEVELPQLNSGEIVVTFIGHSTFLIQSSKYTLITDPVFSERASPVQFAGPKRVRQPAMALEKIPPLDAILVSHNHYDHLDEYSIKKLGSEKTKIFAGLGNQKLLSEWTEASSFDLDWNESHQIADDLKITFLEAQHRSGRAISDQNSTLWGSFLIEIEGKKIFFGGDTGYSDHFKRIHKLYGDMDLSLIPIGAYEPRWFMKEVHMNPEEAMMAHDDLHSKKSIGCHFGTFHLTLESINEPIEKLKKEDFLALDFGESFRLK